LNASLEEKEYREVSHPPAKGSSSGTHRKSALSPPEGGRATVLIVDDDLAIRESLRLMLEDEGYVVAEARDGLEALATLRVATHPMVVLLDIWMPRLGGQDVLREVVRDRRLKSTHAFVVNTANPRALELAFRELLASLGIPVLEKPVDLDALLESIAAATRRLPAKHSEH
jgi:chemosensory pili system protein ChpA (sensor histidine kinase/response regulator)